MQDFASQLSGQARLDRFALSQGLSLSDHLALQADFDNSGQLPPGA